MRKNIFRILNYLNVFYKLKSPDGLRVLAYHTVPDEVKFEKQLNFLLKNYSIIDIHQLRAHLFDGIPLPERAVLITFDDGDVTVLDNGLPLLKKFSIPAVLFVITELIDTSKTFWCRWVEMEYQKMGKSYSEARNIVAHLKETAESERKTFLNKMTPVQSRQLTSEELRELAQNNIYIGNHSHSHPMINNCTKEEIREELFHSRGEFRKLGLGGFSTFAYPNGNWDLKSEEILLESGIEMAFLFDHEINNPLIHPMRISRLKVDTDLDLNEFKVKVSGMHSEIMRAKMKLSHSNISRTYE